MIKQTVAAYGKHPAVWGLSPVNEVGAWTPMDVLRKFYWETYHIVRAGAPRWMFVMDSSFRGSEVGRDGFMKGCPNKALDKHPYMQEVRALPVPAPAPCHVASRDHLRVSPSRDHLRRRPRLTV